MTMAAAASTTTPRKEMSNNRAAAALLASCVPAGGVVSGNDDKRRKMIRVPKGYLPIVLVRDEDGDGEGGARMTTREMRVLVRVIDLKEPCITALLEAAEEQFGYGQQGVLRVPCDAQRFHHVVSMQGTQVVQSCYY